MNMTTPAAELRPQLPACTDAAPEPDASPSAPDFEPVQLAWRSDGWTPERQRAFIEELADCGVVREAAARVGMTEQSAYRLRRKPDAAAFNLAWDAAVEIGTERLHSVAFERAVNGTVRRHYFHGEVVGEDRVFDNRLLIYLLGRMGNPRRKWDPEYRLEAWDSWMNAVEDGLARPLPGPDESDGSPVWRSEDGGWLTHFPPPAGFEGEQFGSYGEEDYCRTLSVQEQEAAETRELRVRREEERQRDRYFRRLTEV